jgi:DNA polymerase-3 subunit alpha
MYLNCHSYYSLRYGTITVERLSELAAAAGVQRLVLTDINNTTAYLTRARVPQPRHHPAAG